METNIRKGFHWRSFVSVLIALSFIVLTFTGIVLFIVPPGRIVNWTDWKFLALTKNQWIALHDWSGVIFVIAVVFHLCFNLRAFISYFRSKTAKIFSLRAEWVAALVICVVVCSSAILNITPFSKLMAWNDSIKYRWDNPSQQSDVQGARFGRMILKQYCKQMNLDVNEAIKKRKDAGFAAKPEMTMREIAASAGAHPSEIRTFLNQPTPDLK